MIVGLFFSIWITITPIQINQIVFDIHSLLLFNLLFLVGFNMVLFSIQTHVYASRAGLIPTKLKYEKLLVYFSLEKGLLLGFLITLIGLIVAIMVYFEWSINQFNYMDTRFTMRQFIPAIFSIIMGSQIVFSSFFISIMGIKTRKLDT